MNPWRPLPLLRLVMPFTAGIIAGQSCHFSLPFAFIFIFSGFSLIALAGFHMFSRSFRYRFLPPLLILPSLFILGFQIAALRSAWRDQDYQAYERPVVLLAKVSDCPQLRQGSVTAICDILAVREGTTWSSANSKLYLKVYSGKNGPGLTYGSSFLVHGQPEKLAFFSDSHSFNFREYLFKKGIRYEMSINAGGIAAVKDSCTFSFNRLAFEARDRLLQIFRDKHLSGQEFAVASALLLGYVNEIDGKLKSAFAASGTMHILSVSGMHVGIIFLFLETILAFFLKFRHGIHLKSGIQLLFVWAYAAITGFSPAVLRAAACLSFLIIGKSIRRKPEMLNIISASVFLLLIIDPLIISDVGFQLSYIAVLGIVILYKPIYDMYVTHRWLPDKIWALMAVSMAAQIATCPLSLYYFHRFPNYFLLSNLLIVPLSNGIILMGILALLCSSIPLIGALCISALKILLTCLNKSVLWIGSLPGAITQGFFPDLTAVILMYLFIGMVFLFIMRKRPACLLAALTCLILIQTAELNERLRISSHSTIYVHSNKQGYAIRFVKGQHEICFYSGLRMMKDGFTSEQIGNERMAKRVDQVQERSVKFCGWQAGSGFPEAGRFGGMIMLGGKRVYLLNHSLSRNFQHKLKTDILLIAASANFTMEQLIRVFSPRLILNVSNAYRSRVLNWEAATRKSGIKFYDLRTSGFYQEEL